LGRQVKKYQPHLAFVTAPVGLGDAGMFVYWALQGDKETGRGLPGKVFAVEPLQQNRRVMEHNLKRHDLLAKVTFFGESFTTAAMSQHLQF